jgi:Cu/Ag efflux protein CusF
MIARIHRLSFLILVPLVLAACATAEPAVAQDPAAAPLGVDLGGSGPVSPTPYPPSLKQAALMGEGEPLHAHTPGMQMAHDGQNDVHATGTVNSVDPGQRKVNLSHQPIPEIGWPAMTMDFAVAPNVDLRAIKPGARINFTIEKGQGGMYEIHAITPAVGGR